jgi:uncharacterized protein
MSDNAKQGEFCWNELMTPDVKKSKEFYSILFGWEMDDHEMGNITYTMLKKGDKTVGGMMQIPQTHEKEIPPHWMSYVYVEDLDATVEKAKTLGANIKQPPKEVGDIGRLAVLQDPTGAHIALWQSTKTC